MKSENVRRHRLFQNKDTIVGSANVVMIYNIFLRMILDQNQNRYAFRAMALTMY